ncbi:uncharacterized protein LOC112340710 [Selaginella moellendorffii]|uniref:uncharacterized protein LOC112340710 n=1 Tax=Selaginella moellendorffii TaxID=88036 RepID=UPI000D1C3166|nr:uncharacterized protein LOC112340710 [Selaginella moellendorffii]|eukprot:XP_024515325.1 uncharacterized protein LOC112340710 [Selaginella moellendorffii]
MGRKKNSLLWALQLLAFLALVSGDQDDQRLSIIDSGSRVLDGGDAAKIECPVSCLRADPVCGANGVTYWCGSRDAACDGVEISHTGYCSPGNGGGLGKGAMAGQALLLVHLVWLMLAGVLVLFGIP